MTGIEVIVAALVAGATAGVNGAASSAVQDAYIGLREAVRRHLGGRPAAEKVLDSELVDPAAYRAGLGAVLGELGADHDDAVLAAARRLLELADPAGTRAHKYIVDLDRTNSAQVGDGNVQVDHNYGVAAATVTAPISFSYGNLPVPPRSPGAA